MRIAAAEALREAGLQIIEAANGEEALAHIQSGLIPDALFTDVQMPGAINGLDLAREVANGDSLCAIFVTSGADLPRDALLDGFVFVPKPYDFCEIACRIKTGNRYSTAANLEAYGAYSASGRRLGSSMRMPANSDEDEFGIVERRDRRDR